MLNLSLALLLLHSCFILSGLQDHADSFNLNLHGDYISLPRANASPPLNLCSAIVRPPNSSTIIPHLPTFSALPLTTGDVSHSAARTRPRERRRSDTHTHARAQTHLLPFEAWRRNGEQTRKGRRRSVERAEFGGEIRIWEGSGEGQPLATPAVSLAY